MDVPRAASQTDVIGSKFPGTGGESATGTSRRPT